MDAHKYVRVDKFKNHNCPYALVRGVVFGSIYDAESYCTREGLDPNVFVQSESPEVLAECKRIAEATLPMLREIQARIREGWKNTLAKSEATAAARDEAEKEHKLGWEVHQDWALQASGAVGGFYDCMTMLNPYIETLERIRRIKA